MFYILVTHYVLHINDSLYITYELLIMFYILITHYDLHFNYSLCFTY